MKARTRKIPPVHQDTFVSRFPACRVPMNDPGEELAPPKLAARPLPSPLCMSTAATRTMLSRMRRARRKVYIQLYKLSSAMAPDNWGVRVETPSLREADADR
jgi:hypothetical protein